MAYDDWQPRFLLSLREVYSVADAAAAAGVTRSHVYQVRKEDPAFAAQWEEAQESAIDALERAAFERAKNISDPLIQFLLKAHRPRVYKDRVEVTGADGQPLIVASISDIRAGLAARLAEGDAGTFEVTDDQGDTRPGSDHALSAGGDPGLPA